MAQGLKNKLNSYFQIEARGSSIRTEIVAGLTTFVTMAYIIFVNPDILSTTGMDFGAVFVATCLAAALGSFIMGLWARWPIGMAPGMGLNAFFAFGVVGGMGFTWQAALGAVFISGLVFLFLSATGIRRWLVAGIPVSMRSGIAAGIGLFLAIIALKNAGIVVDNPATLVGMGNMTATGPLLASAGFIVIVGLEKMGIKGSILIGILFVTVVSIFIGHSEFGGIVSMPPSIAPTFMQMDIMGALSIGITTVLLSLVLVEMFDATGTLIGVASRAGLMKKGPLHTNKDFGKSLMADSTAIAAGAVLGTSSTTAYVESASGVQAGGRTGLTALVIGVLFLAALFFSPLAGSVPAVATAPALLYVATLMCRELTHIDFEDVTEAAPAVLTALLMPFTYSIANGLAFGFIAYVAVKLASGQFRQIHPATALVAALFIANFYIGAH